MCNWFFKTIILLTVAACSTRGPDKSSQTLPIDPNMPQKIILFIPGYYGSMLKEKSSGEIRWAKASNFLFSQVGVSTRIPGTQIGSDNELVIGDVLKNVLLLPKFWDIDSYGKTLELLGKFADENQMRVETAAYDWRDDFHNSVLTVDQKIKSLNLKPDDELYVVSHSTGALLMAYYLRYGTQDVDNAVENWEGLKMIKKAALIAPPLHGLMILMRDIEDGTRVGINRSLLSGLEYSTFKSSYFFLPPRGEDIALSESKEKIELGIHDVDKWQKNNWGPFKYAKPEEVAAVHEFVQRYLSRSEKFHALLRAPIKIQPPKKLPLFHMRGLGTETKEYASLKAKGEILSYSFDKEGQVDGDGTVTIRSGVPLEYFKAMDFTTMDSGLGHLEMLAMPESQIFIQEFLKK
jgi:pimeloyl-ACP methyl ester carboxylesterase